MLKFGLVQSEKNNSKPALIDAWYQFLIDQHAMADVNSGCAASDGWPRLIAVETHSIDKKDGAIWLRTFLLVYENLNISSTMITVSYEIW